MPQAALAAESKDAAKVDFTKQAASTANKKTAKAFTPKLRVTLTVGNEFEGKTYELFHEADTLSILLAQQGAAQAARKNTGTLRSSASM